MKHYPQFAVLRGFASVWVYIGHAIMICGISSRFVPSGELAVELFMILSGFVITLLRISKEESYDAYLFRRFMRLYPLFLVALLMGLATMHLYLPVLGQTPLFTGNAEKFIARDLSVENYFWQHIAAHLTMLHGAIPDKYLPQSSLAFSGPLWSISLEWQFYLFAPLIIWGLDWRKQNPYIVTSMVVLLLSSAIISARFWTPGIVPAFLGQRIDLFVLGVLCGISWNTALRSHILKTAVFSFVAILVYRYGFHHNKLPLLMWFAVYLTACAGTTYKLTGLLNEILSSRLAVWIGDRSYGLYVLHMPIMLAVAYYIALPTFSNSRSLVFISILVISTPLVLVFTALCYTYIEKPTIAWARNYGRILDKSNKA